MNLVGSLQAKLTSSSFNSFSAILLFLLGIAMPSAAQFCTPPPPGGGGQTCPTLTSVSPSIVTAGSRQQRLTILGTNFNAGSRVIISIPNTDPTQPATDVALASTRVVSSTMIIVTIDVNRLSSGLRMVDVINPPISEYIPNTGPNFPWGPSSTTTQQILITPSDSLAGPLQVQNLLLTYPRDGTIIRQGDEVYGEAVLAGAGTGLVTGFWLWDGNVVEQFAENLIGGESAVIRSSNPLPSVLSGPHTLQLQVTSPQAMTSRPVQVVVNGGDWQALRLLVPRFGANYAGVSGPALRWTPVPGAAKYEVGFSTQPLFDQVFEWHEVTDNMWTVPNQVWAKLPEGELFWTARPVDMSGTVRRPAPMRLITHLPPGALHANPAIPGLSQRGSIVLQWNPTKTKAFYFVTISSDAAATNVLRRYLTAAPQLDLYALQATLRSGQVYFWQVEALTPAHRTLLTGPRQSFQVPVSRAQTRRPAPPHAGFQLASLRTLEPLPAVTRISRRNPAPGETITSNQPGCEIGFTEPVDTNNLSLGIDGVDVTAMAEVAPETLKYHPVFPLDNGEHTVELDLKTDSEDWKFNVAANPEPETQPAAVAVATSNNDAEVGPKTEGLARTSDEVGPEFKTHFGFDPQLGSSPTPNQITVTGGEQLTFQRGGWKADFNGSGMMQAAITPQPDRLFGRVQDYVGQLDYTHTVWDFGTRFGLLAPSMYGDAEFITTAVPRQAVEPKIVTPGGTFRYYANTNDVNAGAGDTSSYHQWIRGAGYEAPVPPKWATLRLMWMNARDIGSLLGTTTMATTMQSVVVSPDPSPQTQLMNASAITPPMSTGDIYGGLLKVRLPINVDLVSEYAVSRNNPDRSFDPATNPLANPDTTSTNTPLACPFAPTLVGDIGYVPADCSAVFTTKRLFGRALRAGLTGHWKKTKISISYRDITPDFFNPANLSITPLSNPNRRGLDSSMSQGTPWGDFQIAYQYLQSDHVTLNQPATVTSPSLPALQLAKQPSTDMRNLTWSWRKKLKTRSQFMIRGHEALISSANLPASYTGVDRITLAGQGLLTDQRDIGFNGSFLQGIGGFDLSATVSRDWFRNSAIFGQNAIVTGTQYAVSSRRISFFQWQSTWSANWAVRDKSTQGGTRILSVYLLPTFWLPQSTLSVSPLLSITTTKGELGAGIVTANLLSSQMGGRLSWKLPALLRHATFSLEGSRVQLRDNLNLAIPSGNLVDKRLAMMLSFIQDQSQGRL